MHRSVFPLSSPLIIHNLKNCGVQYTLTSKKMYQGSNLQAQPAVATNGSQQSDPGSLDADAQLRYNEFLLREQRRRENEEKQRLPPVVSPDGSKCLFVASKCFWVRSLTQMAQNSKLTTDTTANLLSASFHPLVPSSMMPSSA